MSSLGQPFPDGTTPNGTTDAYRLTQLGIPPDHAIRIAAANRANHLAMANAPAQVTFNPSSDPWADFPDAEEFAFGGPAPVVASVWQGLATDQIPMSPSQNGQGAASEAFGFKNLPIIPRVQLARHTTGRAARACLPNVGNFVQEHLPEAEDVAARMPIGVSPQEVLATSGLETQYGAPTPPGSIGNWYGMHMRDPRGGSLRDYRGQIGVYYAKGGSQEPRFPGGLSGPAGDAFVQRAGPLLSSRLFDPSDPLSYFAGLHGSSRPAGGPWGQGRDDYDAKALSAYNLVGDCLE